MNKGKMADYLLDIRAGLPVTLAPGRRKELCDGCGRTKYCHTYWLDDDPNDRCIDLCLRCEKFFIDKGMS